MSVGLLMVITGMLWFSQIGVHSGYWDHLFPAELVMAFGMGMVFVPVNNTALVGVAPANAGVASALINSTQQVGGSIGTALLNTIATTVTASYLQVAPGGRRARGHHHGGHRPRLCGGVRGGGRHPGPGPGRGGDLHQCAGRFGWHARTPPRRWKPTRPESWRRDGSRRSEPAGSGGRLTGQIRERPRPDVSAAAPTCTLGRSPRRPGAPAAVGTTGSRGRRRPRPKLPMPHWRGARRSNSTTRSSAAPTPAG